MLATSVRVSPWSALWRFSSGGPRTAILSPPPPPPPPAGNQPADFALRALHGDPQAVELSGHALGHWDRLPSDARHGGGLLTRPRRAARRRCEPCVLRGPS